MGELWSRNFIPGVVPIQGKRAELSFSNVHQSLAKGCLWENKLGHFQFSAYIGTPAQVSQGQNSEESAGAGSPLEAKHSEAEGGTCRNGNRDPRGTWSTYRAHHKNDLFLLEYKHHENRGLVCLVCFFSPSTMLAHVGT